MGNWLMGNYFLPLLTFRPFNFPTPLLPGAPARIRQWHSDYFLGAFFLPATVLRLPLRVRLLVRVR